MQNKITRFLTASLIVVLASCITVFTALSIYLSKQSDETISQLGNIYMASMNDRITKHFQTMTEHRLVQLETMCKTVPASYRQGKARFNEWMTIGGQARAFDSLSYCFPDGSFEAVYGGGATPLSPEYVLRTFQQKERRIVIGDNSDGEDVILICVPVSIPVPGMEDCIGLIGELPVSDIARTLSLDENEDSLIYSFVVRKDGSFVIRSSDAFRSNYFERIRAIYEELDGKTAEDYVAEISAAMENGADYSSIFKMYGERRHMYLSSLPNSVWYLVTFMPYGALNESVETLGTRSLYATLICCAVILLVLTVVFLLYFRMNLTQTRELEQARSAAEEASRSKSEFLSNMSHDIRTPMNAIVGMTTIAAAHVDDPQQVQNCLKKISLSGKHLLGLINDVLDMSKIESGKMTLNVELVSLREVLDSIVTIVQPQMKAKNQKFNISIYDITSENVHCDSVRLNQILLNLLSNAVKFTPDGGSIAVVLHEEPSPKGEDHIRIRIHVKDTGIGMSEEFQEHIFDAFTREETKRVNKIEGTGLGMAITKYIVDAMGGEIKVKSQQGAGTEFQVVLDLERAEERVEDMILPDWNMLVVDDDRQLCESTVESLRSIGIRAEWVLDGETAVRTVLRRHSRRDDYHVILLDWKLPDMDGINTARELRRQLGNDVPILLMSAYDWSEIEDEARAAGISGFLMKPLFRSTLYYGLKPYAGGESAYGPEDAATSDFSGKRLLVAEDNELNWEIACELLKELGLELEWAENGQLCVDMFKKSPPGYYDAILMDLRMPVLGGCEAADAIRAMDRPDANIPIAAMTADAYSDDIQRCLDHGMNAHIAKPIDLKEVARVLKRFLN